MRLRTMAALGFLVSKKVDFLLTGSGAGSITGGIPFTHRTDDRTGTLHKKEPR
jgi:hypothetical protein